MNPELKAKWIEALRSGKYEQTTDALRYVSVEEGSTGFCCLGVLCDIIDPNGWDSWDNFDNHKLQTNKDMSLIENEEVTGLSHKIETRLAELNDGGKSFKYIASYIKRYL